MRRAASPPAFKSTNRLQGSIMERVSGMAAPSAGPLSLVLTFNLIFVVAVPPVVGWFKTMPVESDLLPPRRVLDPRVA